MQTEEVYEDRRAQTAVAALSRLTLNGRRHRVKARPRYSIRNDTYRVAPSLRDDVHELAQLPFRADVAERVQMVAVLILRLRGGPAAMTRWKQWPMPLAFVAQQLEISVPMARTAMAYLESELIERAPCEIDIHGRPVRAKKVVHRNGKRITIDKPTLWQFTPRFRDKLDRIHGFNRRSRNSHLGRSSWKFFLGKYKDETGLAKRFIEDTESNLPSCDLQTVPRLKIEPPSKPAMHCSVPSPHYRPMSEHITTALKEQQKPSNVPPGVLRGPMFPNCPPAPRWVDTREETAQRALEIARARRTPERLHPSTIHYRKNAHRWQLVE